MTPDIEPTEPRLSDNLSEITESPPGRHQSVKSHGSVTRISPLKLGARPNWFLSVTGLVIAPVSAVGTAPFIKHNSAAKGLRASRGSLPGGDHIRLFPS
ncbi:hypothetical protein BDW68DRAFT_102379 [Aspergillus falconensis]